MGLDSQKSFAALSDEPHPMASLLDQYEPACDFKSGQVVRGTIIRIDPEIIVIDVGAKCEGVVSGSELDRLDPELLSTLKPGDEVSVYVLKSEGAGGEVVLSLARALENEDWQRAQALMKKREVLELEVVGSNRGGLLVQLGNTRGFVPASQLALSRSMPRISDPDCSKILGQMVGEKLKLRVIEADRERNRLILSERTALLARREEQEKQFLGSLQEGEVRQGKISNLTDFGAFVNLGELDGLLHLSEISWHPVKHPSDAYEVGQEIKVMILSIDHDRRQVALSAKRLEPNPWASITDRYQVGQLVEGRITRLMKWGAFARLVDDEAIEGLVHISELSEGHVVHPRDVVTPGDVVTLRIVRIEPDRRRLALSLKQVTEGEHAGVDWRADYESSSQPPMESPMASALDEAMQG